MKPIVIIILVFGALSSSACVAAQFGPAAADAITGVQQIDSIPDESLSDSVINSPQIEQDDWRGKLGRLINSIYECPLGQAAVGERLKKPLFTDKMGWEAMNDQEKKECHEEGSRRATERVADKIRAMPAQLMDGVDKAKLYLGARKKAQASQCETDFDEMEKAYYAFMSINNQIVPDEEFHRDYFRIAKHGLLSSLPKYVESAGIKLSVATSFTTETRVPTLTIEVSNSPEIPFETEFRQVLFTLNPDYGPGTMLASIVNVDVKVPEIEIDPLPIEVTPISINWERKPRWNISDGTYTGGPRVRAGNVYCSHTIHVYSANNVCSNTIDVSPQGLTITAQIYSGSAVDKWRGWLRANGEMVSIAESATSCQVARAKCARNYGTSQLTPNDPWCRGRAEWEDSRSQELCGREGFPGKEICHYGTINDQGRCVIEKSVACY